MPYRYALCHLQWYPQKLGTETLGIFYKSLEFLADKLVSFQD